MLAAKLGVVLLLVSGLEAGPGPKPAPGPAPEPAPWGWRFINSNGVQAASGNPFAIANPYVPAAPIVPSAPVLPVVPDFNKVLPVDGIQGSSLPWTFINAEQPQGVVPMSGDQISISMGGPWWWKKK